MPKTLNFLANSTWTSLRGSRMNVTPLRTLAASAKMSDLPLPVGKRTRTSLPWTTKLVAWNCSKQDQELNPNISWQKKYQKNKERVEKEERVKNHIFWIFEFTKEEGVWASRTFPLANSNKYYKIWYNETEFKLWGPKSKHGRRKGERKKGDKKEQKTEKTKPQWAVRETSNLSFLR